MDDPRIFEAAARPDKATATTLAHAFRDDPALAWIVTDAKTRRAMLPRFFALMAEQSARLGTVLSNADHSAAALLYPAGEVNDERLRDTLRLLAMFKTTLPRAMKVAEAMHARHPHPQPFSYLRYVGVAPHAQGTGLGGAIIRDVIARAAAIGQGVLLETATPSNVAIYARLGFVIQSEWEVPGGKGILGPKFWTMIHPAP